MKKTGASLVTYALEQLGVQFTFGIPGVHNTELYDELNKSKKIKPILVTHECGGAFMADAISRTTDSTGTLVIVPAAGMTHALSGIGEAFLDGVPMLVISGGIRTDSKMRFQLHELEMGNVLDGITKGYFKIEKHKDIVPTIYKAFDLAHEGMGGPVFVEVPVNIQLFKGEVSSLPKYTEPKEVRNPNQDLIDQAIQLLSSAKSVGIFAGWGAREATPELIEIAERLAAPVSTTLQGLSVFPANHPLHTGMGFGAYSVPAAENAFKNVDVLLAVGTRFSEIPTGSFGMKVPSKLIHIDIEEEALFKNYPTKVGICADAKLALAQILEGLKRKSVEKDSTNLSVQIRADKEKYKLEWEKHNKKGKVNPFRFFESLRSSIPDDSITVVDDGNHTYLTAELFPIHKSKCFITPSDFNSMGYCVPASIGAKLSNPKRTVVGIVGDGALMMTGMELITASRNKLGVVIFVFHDGELSQISQGQEIPYSRKTCTVLGDFQVEGLAQATGCHYVSMKDNSEIEKSIGEALQASQKGKPVLVDVNIDYSKRTRFTQGVVKANLARFPTSEKVRFIGRAITRKLTG